MKLEKVNYSEKALAVIGQTKEIKTELAAIGGRFNPYLSCGAGWIFSKTKEPLIDSIISKYSNQVAIEAHPVIIREKKKQTLIGIPKECHALLKNQPGCFEEAVLHFFIKGGQVKTAQLQSELGYKSYKDLKPYFGMYAANGASLDLLYEQPEFEGVRYTNQTGRDFIDSIIEVLVRCPGKGIMSRRLIQLNNTQEPDNIWEPQEAKDVKNAINPF